MSKLQPFSQLWINNQETASISGKQITLIDPSTGKEWFKVDEADLEDVNVAVEHAEAAWPAWAELPGAARGKALRKFAELMVKHHEDLAEVESKTMGKPWQFLKFDVLISAAIIDYFASLADTAQSSVSTNTPGMFNYTLHQPYGVTAAIIPWNITFASFAFKVGASLAAGNALILKSSEKAPLSPLLLAKLGAEAGFPPGILQVISGFGPTAGAALAKHQKVRKISFTGSLAVGKLVQEMGAKSNLKAVTLELGGKSPGIVFADADLQEAAEALAFSITAWTGQTCIATSRVYVHSSVHDKFVDLFTKAIQAATSNQGPAYDISTNWGPLVDSIQFEKVKKYLEKGKTEAKTLVTGGGHVGDGQGYYVQPTIYSGVSDDAVINKEEIFGPVVVVNSFETDEEALKRANDSEYGLYASIFTQDIRRALKFSKALEAGCVAVNTSSPNIAIDMPFGGFKLSGQGRELGPDAVRAWQETKSVFIKL